MTKRYAYDIIAACEGAANPVFKMIENISTSSHRHISSSSFVIHNGIRVIQDIPAALTSYGELAYAKITTMGELVLENISSYGEIVTDDIRRGFNIIIHKGEVVNISDDHQLTLTSKISNNITVVSNGISSCKRSLSEIITSVDTYTSGAIVKILNIVNFIEDKDIWLSRVFRDKIYSGDRRYISSMISKIENINISELYSRSVSKRFTYIISHVQDITARSSTTLHDVIHASDSSARHASRSYNESVDISDIEHHKLGFIYTYVLDIASSSKSSGRKVIREIVSAHDSSSRALNVIIRNVTQVLQDVPASLTSFGELVYGSITSYGEVIYKRISSIGESSTYDPRTGFKINVSKHSDENISISEDIGNFTIVYRIRNNIYTFNHKIIRVYKSASHTISASVSDMINGAKHVYDGVNMHVEESRLMKINIIDIVSLDLLKHISILSNINHQIAVSNRGIVNLNRGIRENISIIQSKTYSIFKRILSPIHVVQTRKLFPTIFLDDSVSATDERRNSIRVLISNELRLIETSGISVITHAMERIRASSLGINRIGRKFVEICSSTSTGVGTVVKRIHNQVIIQDYTYKTPLIINHILSNGEHAYGYITTSGETLFNIISSYGETIAYDKIPNLKLRITKSVHDNISIRQNSNTHTIYKIRDAISISSLKRLSFRIINNITLSQTLMPVINKCEAINISHIHVMNLKNIIPNFINISDDRMSSISKALSETAFITDIWRKTFSRFRKYGRSILSRRSQTKASRTTEQVTRIEPNTKSEFPGDKR